VMFRDGLGLLENSGVPKSGVQELQEFRIGMSRLCHTRYKTLHRLVAMTKDQGPFTVRKRPITFCNFCNS